MEGVFALPAALRAALADRLPEDADELVLARRVSAEGRTRAYLGGRSATAADLADDRRCAAVLLRPARAPAADAGVGAARDPGRLLRRRAGGAERGVRRGVRTRTRAARRSSRRCAPGPVPATASSTSLELGARRDRPRGAERRGGALAARRARAPPPCRDAARRRRGRRRGAGRGRRRRRLRRRVVGPRHRRRSARPWRRSRRPRAWMLRSTRSPSGRAALAVEAEDLVGELRRYGEAVDAPPGRLDEVEERLALFDRLKRKHGGTIEAVLAHAEECRRRRDELAGAEEALEAGRGAAGAARAELAAQAEGAARGAPRGRRRPRRRGARAARRPGDGGRDVRGAPRRAGGLRPDRAATRSSS